MAQAEALYALQKIDLEIIGNRRRLKEIATALEEDDVVTAAQQAVENAEETLRPLRAEMRNLELEMQSNTDKSGQSESRLYSGNVKNPKEMQDLQNEVAALKSRNETLEEKLLEQMMDVEEAEGVLQDANEYLETVTSDWEQGHADLLTEQSDLETAVKELFDRRTTALQSVNEDTLKRYDTMRRQKANQPVAILNGRSCSVCGVEQTISTAQEVRRRAALVFCENCGRILADV